MRSRPPALQFILSVLSVLSATMSELLPEEPSSTCPHLSSDFLVLVTR